MRTLSRASSRGVSELVERCDEVAQLLKTLAHPQRLMILCYLSEGERSVSELEKLSGASQSAVSQFLNRMKYEGLVKASRSGSFIHYRISDPRVLGLIQSFSKIFCK